MSKNDELTELEPLAPANGGSGYWIWIPCVCVSYVAL